MAEPDDDPAVEQLLTFLRDSRGLDFTGYKRPSLTRRIRKRMESVDVESFDAYRDYLEVHPDEHTQLVDTILINVTSFFRDEEAWDHLAESVVPAIVEGKAEDAPIRIWSAGCASGEEAYSVAMVMADHLGIEQFRSRVKIYATDTDDAALAEARAGVFTADQLAPVSTERRARYFEPDGPRFVFRADCRRSVIFGRHDITADAPISRLDLLVCRNVLMYLVRDTQRRVLSRFHYALEPDGCLFLGRAETIFAHADLFEAESPGFRIFRRLPESGGRDQVMSLAAATAAPPDRRRLRELASTASPLAQLVIDVDGVLVEANSRARAMFGVTGADLGRPFRDLEVSYRPIELRSRIEQAYAEERPVVMHEVERPLAEGRQFLEVAIAPLFDAGGVALGASVTFADVTELGRTKTELERSARDLEQANEGLHSANEELETSNEELQSTNEELETTNEELQSANEELETMNEELQSANEELETMNVDLLGQASQIERSGRFLSSLLDSLTVGVVVVDEAFDVAVWNRAMENLFGLRAEEATGRSVLALDIGLPVGEIGPLLHEAVQGSVDDVAEILLDAVNRTGRAMRCRVTVQLLADGPGVGVDGAGHFVVLVDPLPEV